MKPFKSNILLGAISLRQLPFLLFLDTLPHALHSIFLSHFAIGNLSATLYVYYYRCIKRANKENISFTMDYSHPKYETVSSFHAAYMLLYGGTDLMHYCLNSFSCTIKGKIQMHFLASNKDECETSFYLISWYHLWRTFSFTTILY